MRFFRVICPFLGVLCAGIQASSQDLSYLNRLQVDTVPALKAMELNPWVYRNIDTVWQYSGICKVLKVSRSINQRNIVKSETNKNGGISIHGNVTYDFLYRSFSDTPYHQKDLRQHTVQTSLRVAIKDKYYFRVNLTNRIGNSPYFRDFFNGGLQYDRQTFLNRRKLDAENRVLALTLQQPELERIEASLGELLQKYNGLKYSLSRPNLSQSQIEEREKLYFEKFNKKIPGVGLDDSIKNKVSNYVNSKKQEMDSLKVQMTKLLQAADSIKNSLYKSTALLKHRLRKAKNSKELAAILSEHNVSADNTSGIEKLLSDTRSLGIGRSILNYSELTVNNVSLTGLNIEYNPRLYMAFAAGKIDYGFRDFISSNKRSNRQRLLMGRFGIGNPDLMSVILSVYTGRKFNYGSILNDSTNGYINVAGYSIEGIYRKNANTGVSIEIAKSTRPVTGSFQDNKEMNSLFKFSDQSNQAISVKAQTIISETDSRISGFFRKSGENFQSFSLFTYNTDQTAWMLKADQPFLKNRATFTAMIRRNDFTNPFTEKTFKTSTVFFAGQLSLRAPKLPAISVGYHPGSQIYLIDRERVRENVYYILNGSVIHSYRLWGTNMVTSAIYNYYSNKGTDSGFVNYNGASYMLSHAILFHKFQLGGNYIYNDQQELKFHTVEANADYFPKSFLKVGIGGKYSRTEYKKSYWGGKAQMLLEIKKLGGIQLQYEKSFLPTIYQTLFPVDMGRVSWFKNF